MQVMGYLRLDEFRGVKVGYCRVGFGKLWLWGLGFMGGIAGYYEAGYDRVLGGMGMILTST